MKYFDVVLWATAQGTVTVAARDEDEAAEIALQIIKGGFVPCNDLHWEIEEVNTGDPLDVARNALAKLKGEQA